MTEAFLDPYDIWNPKWSPLDFNSFKWIVKPSRLSPMNGEFKVAVDVAGFTATDDKLDVEVMLENNKQMLCIQGEHVDDDGQCFTRRNLLKLYRIDGECVPETLCVFIADDVLVARVLVVDKSGSPVKHASLHDSVVRSESQTEIKQYRDRAPAEKRHVSSISTAVKQARQPEGLQQVTYDRTTTLVRKTVSPPLTVASPSLSVTSPTHLAEAVVQPSGGTAASPTRVAATTLGANPLAETTVSPQAQATSAQLPKSAVLSTRSLSQGDSVRRAVPGTSFGTFPPSQFVAEQGRALVSQEAPEQRPPTAVSKRATGDIMKLMSRFTGQHETSKGLSPPSPSKQSSPPSPPTPDTCVVHEARRASVVKSIRPGVDEFAPDVESVHEDDINQDEAENFADFTVTIPKTRSGSGNMQSRADSGNPTSATTSGPFSHPYEEVEECEMEQKFRESHFSAAMNPHAGDEGQDVLRVTLDVSDFRSDQLAMFIIGDEIVVNVEIVRLVGSNKSLTKRYKLPANADKSNVHSLLTSEGLLQIDVPLLKRSEPPQMTPAPEAVSTTNF